MKHMSDTEISTANNLALHIQRLREELNTADRESIIRKNSARHKIRSLIVKSEAYDSVGAERLIGRSDLVSINYLSKGIKTSRGVCRIRIPSNNGEWYGTGFLVAPGLLMTNNHVIGTKSDAAQAEAEFDFEHDADGVLSKPIQFNLKPHTVFFTNRELDVTFIAVAPLSDSGIPLHRFGYLPLVPASGKGLHGEWVTIIQHPHGGPKQISVRSNQIIDISLNAKGHKSTQKMKDKAENFVHYATDTEPGSSGAPVINDQWQVVAIHHKAIPAPKYLSQLQKRTISIDDPSIEWIANEGVRISAIHRMLHGKRFSEEAAALVLDHLSHGLGLPHRPSKLSVGSIDSSYERESRPHNQAYWSEKEDSFKLGYDDGFLSIPISIHEILHPVMPILADRNDNKGKVLDYLHFSAAIHEERKFAVMTAVNICGQKLRHPGGRPPWRRDIRMHEIFQPGDNFYMKKKGNDPVRFDRGHLVRRFDPCWGTDAEVKLANKHTFHFSNAAPQISRYNGSIWGDLEDYVLNQTQTKEKNVSVFSGPIFRDDDPWYGETRENGPWRIPVSYWKIAVIQKPDGEIAAAGFVLGQIQYLDSLYESKIFKLTPYTAKEIQDGHLQVSIQKIMDMTDLDFSMLLSYDTQNALEIAHEVRMINTLSDIII